MKKRQITDFNQTSEITTEEELKNRKDVVRSFVFEIFLLGFLAAFILFVVRLIL